jgi:hypothetical protein
LDKLERWFGRFALPNVTLYLIIGQVFLTLSALLGLLDLRRFELIPYLALHGEPWRFVSFLFLPPPVSSQFGLVLLPFGWWLFYLMGSALEQFWGAFRYNVFLLVAVVLTIAAALLTPGAVVPNLFIAGSVFLAFAWLNPDFELAIFFILPVKIKWLAALTWALYAVNLIRGDFTTRLQVVASVSNFFLFFARDIVTTIRYRRRQMSTTAARVASESREREPRHRCYVCGKTDLTNPEMDFRYCSKCTGDQCYCPEHIFNHQHVLGEDGGPTA